MKPNTIKADLKASLSIDAASFFDEAQKLNSQATAFLFVGFRWNESALPEGLAVKAISNGYEIVVSKNLSEPIHFIFIHSPEKQTDPQAEFKVQFRVSAGVVVQILESHYSEMLSTDTAISGKQNAKTVFEVNLARDAKVQWVFFQQSTQATAVEVFSKATVAANGCLEKSQIVLGGPQSKISNQIFLEDKNASVSLSSGSVLSGKEKVNFENEIRHVIGETTSQLLIKSVLGGKARQLSQGKVVIEKDAQKSDSRQMSRSLTLSDSAEAQSRPELEIFADDVKATHGSTVGQLRQEEIFYLESRGIDQKLAKQMLILGFLNDTYQNYKALDAVLIGEKISEKMGTLTEQDI